MLCTEDLTNKFISLKEYEKYALAWTRECARLNPTEKNLERLMTMEHRAELMGLEE